MPVICDALACGQVEDVPMPPVDTRVPPTSASSATTTTADEPSEVPKAALVGVVESALRQVVEVPIPSIVDARFPPVSVSAAISATTSNTAEDRPCEAPLATIIFADKVAPLQVGDVPALLDHYGSSKDRTAVLCFSMEQQPPSELESQVWAQRAISGTSSTVRPERRSQRQRSPPAWMAQYMLEPRGPTRQEHPQPEWRNLISKNDSSKRRFTGPVFSGIRSCGGDRS